VDSVRSVHLSIVSLARSIADRAWIANAFFIMILALTPG
jgi:hypothetical protein